MSMTMIGEANRDTALALAAQGFAVFPCHSGGKRVKAPLSPPVMSWKEQATSDATQIGRWWSAFPNAAVGLALGKSGLIVVDCDRKEGQSDGVEAFGNLVREVGADVSEVPMVATPNQGTHFFFRVPDGFDHGNGRGDLPAGIDVRGKGGYVIAPGTRMADGREYDVYGDISEAPFVPAWLVERLKAKRAVESASISQPQPRNNHVPADLAEIGELLDYIDPDAHHDEWVQALMAVHAATNGSGAGLDIVDAWSSRGSKYGGRRELETKWKSFRGSGVGLGTLATMAEQAGANLSEIAIRHRGQERDHEAVAHGARVASMLLGNTQIDPATGEILDDAPANAEIRENPVIELGTATSEEECPETLMHPGGVVSEIADWICEWTDAPLRLHALGAALSVTGTILGRKVYSRTRPTGTHLYIGAMAPSSVGKQHPMDCARELLDAVAPGHHSGWHASAQSMANVLTERGATLLFADEFADKLQALKGRTASTHQTAISETLRELWGLSTGTFQPSQSVTRAYPPILRPCMGVYGASTLRDFRDSLSSKDVANGLYNRFLFLPRFSIVAGGPEPEGLRAPPERVVAKLKAMYHGLPGLGSHASVRGDIAPAEPILVPFSDEAAAMNEANKAYQNEMRAMADDDAPLALYGRYAEQIKRVALIVACGRVPHRLTDAVIEAQDMRFAEGLVRWSLEQFTLMVRRDMVESIHHGWYVKVLEIVRRSGAIRRRELYQKVKGTIRRRDLDDVIVAMIEGGSISSHTLDGSSKGGPKPVEYRYIRG